MKLLRRALSQESADSDIPLSPEMMAELHDEGDLAMAVGALKEEDDRQIASDVALEAYFEYGQLQAALESAGMVQSPLAKELQRIYAPALEQVALEGFGDSVRNFFDGYIQLLVVNGKHQWNAIADFLTSAEAHVRKYEDKLHTTRREYQEKKPDFRDGEHHLYLGELHYFFTRKNNITAEDTLRALEEDIAFSKFILETAPNEALSVLKKLNGILGSARVNDGKSLKDLIKKVTALPTLDKIFPRRYRGEHILLNNVSVELKPGKPVRPVVIEDDEQIDLADHAIRERIVESRSKLHTFGKVMTAIHPVAAKAAAIGTAVNSEKISTEDIRQIIDSGDQYLKNTRAYMKMRGQIKQALEGVGESCEKLAKHSQVSNQEEQRAIKQIFNYAENVASLLSQPAGDEFLRSIRGAKYCNYLARSVIYNATKYIK